MSDGFKPGTTVPWGDTSNATPVADIMAFREIARRYEVPLVSAERYDVLVVSPGMHERLRVEADRLGLATVDEVVTHYSGRSFDRVVVSDDAGGRSDSGAGASGVPRGTGGGRPRRWWTGWTGAAFGVIVGILVGVSEMVSGRGAGKR